MNLLIRSVVKDDIKDIVALSLAAWEPVFESFKQVLGSNIYTLLYPDWRTQQQKVVETVCEDAEKMHVWVAELEGKVAGFIAYSLNMAEKTGEVELLAVDPQFQNREIGTQLNNFVLQKMKESGIKLAEVGTGGDPGHAAARKSYEKAGYTAFPQVRYFKDL